MLPDLFNFLFLFSFLMLYIVPFLLAINLKWKLQIEINLEEINHDVYGIEYNRFFAKELGLVSNFRFGNLKDKFNV